VSSQYTLAAVELLAVAAARSEANILPLDCPKT